MVFKIDYDKVFTNAEEFYADALHFKEFGCYTKFPYSDNPHSQYYKYWQEQKRRCLDGYDIGRDSITGYHYFYLNFCPIELVKVKGIDTGDRIEDFPRFWDGDYMFYHLIDEAEQKGKHFVALMTRGVGKSYKGGAMLDRNYYIIPGSKSYAVASEKEYLINDGILTKAFKMMDFIDINTAFGKRRQYMDQPLHKRSSFKEDVGGIKIESGYKSEIMGISVLDTPGRIRGKRGKLMIFEEAGINNILLDCWNIALRSFGKGKITHGLMLAIGTGGAEESDFDGLRELFYNPGGYKIYSMPNIWDESPENECAYFHPAYYTLEGFIDENGNSDIESGKEFLLKERECVKKDSDNPETVIKYIAEEPFSPQEAIMRTESTIFPVLWLKERLSELETNKKLRDAEETGRFLINSTGEVEFVYSDSVNPIYDYPLKDNKYMDGAPVIYERPYKDNTGNIPYLRYIAGMDPYEQDQSTSTSLGSLIIKDRFTSRIVLEYTGRPGMAEIFYENCRRALIFYNALCNYENNLIKGVFNYFDKMNSLIYLCDTPANIRDKVIDITSLSRGKGTPGTGPINSWGRGLINSWLKSPESTEANKMNLYNIRCIPLLKELIDWKPKKGKTYDRISALGMCQILEADLSKIEYVDVEEKVQKEDFWERNYKKTKTKFVWEK